MIYSARWKYMGSEKFGYIKAKDKDEAGKLLKLNLLPECEIVGIGGEVKEHQITRQNICINFHNPAPEPLFG